MGYGLGGGSPLSSRPGHPGSGGFGGLGGHRPPHSSPSAASALIGGGLSVEVAPGGGFIVKGVGEEGPRSEAAEEDEEDEAEAARTAAEVISCLNKVGNRRRQRMEQERVGNSLIKCDTVLFRNFFYQKFVSNMGNMCTVGLFRDRLNKEERSKMRA